MSNSNDQMSGFASMARSFLANNPRLLDTLVEMLHNVAEELDSLKGPKMITNGRYMQPYMFKQRIIEKIMKKLGYECLDIPDLCNQGRGEELLQEIDRMEKSPILGSTNPSRRVLPIGPPSRKSTFKIEDVTDTSNRSTNK